MVFRNFNTNIIVQVVLIGISCFLLNWSLYQEHLLVAKFTFGIILIIQIILLIDFIKRSNKRLTRFMEWVKNEGLSERFAKIESDGSHEELNSKFNEIIQVLADSKADKEGEHFYFQQTLDTIGTAIISIHENNKIEIFNEAASKLLQCNATNSVEKLKLKHPQFTRFVLNLKNHEQKSIKLNIKNTPFNITAKCVIFKIKDKPIKLISFQDITSELAIEELEAWQKLIRVLRHEIMNSVTPVKSLTSTMIRIFSKDGESKNIEQLNQENIDNALASLLAIDKRNQGMLKFIESYRNLTNIPKPSFENVNLNDFFDHIKILMSEELKSNNVKSKIIIKPNTLMIETDEKLLSQVLINLIRNAIESMINQEEKVLQIEAYPTNSKQIIISISDNGFGIDNEELNNIFIPFYTTKEKGSGIGLSLCRQIMHLHKGRIRVKSIKGEGSTFTLEF